MEYFVKKSIISLILLTCILLQVTGCTEIQIFNNEAENQSTSAQNIENKSTGGGNTDSNCTEIEGTESTLQQTQKRIRNIAYQSIDESAKAEIKNWENSEVEEYKALIDHTIRGQSGFINIKGIDTYRILFDDSNDFIELGPIAIYVDKNTDTVLGYDLRQ